MSDGPQPSFTIAIPTYNGAEHLRQALRSAKAQEGLDLDFLLSDDRSDDETLAIARQELGDAIRIIVNSERLGLAGNWNQCVRLAETPLIATLHQDDVLLKNHLANHLKVFETNPDIGLCASASKVIDRNGEAVAASVVGVGGLGNEDRVFKPGDVLPLMADGNPFRCSAVSLRVSAFDQTKGFDPRLRYVVDWAFWIELAKAHSVGWLAEPTALVRWHLESETHRFAKGTVDLEETEQLMASLIDSLELSPPSLRAFRSRSSARLARAYLNRAHVAAKAGNAALARKAWRRAFALDRSGSLKTVLSDASLLGRLLLNALAPERFGSQPPGSKEKLSEKL